MSDSIMFALTVFIGWLIFDIVKHKTVNKENVMGALFVALIAGGAWFVLDLIFV